MVQQMTNEDPSGEKKRMSIALDTDVADKVEELAKSQRSSQSATINRMLADVFNQPKDGLIPVALDPDVIEAAKSVAAAQRETFSGMVNRMLASVLGLMPRLKDQWKDKK